MAETCRVALFGILQGYSDAVIMNLLLCHFTKTAKMVHVHSVI